VQIKLKLEKLIISLAQKFEQKVDIQESDTDLHSIVQVLEEYFSQNFSANEILSSGILKVIKTINNIFQDKTKTQYEYVTPRISIV